MSSRTMVILGAVSLAMAAKCLSCGISNEPAGKPPAPRATADPASSEGTREPPVQLWQGGAFPCAETVLEIQVTEVSTGASDDHRFSAKTTAKLELSSDKERIRAICAALGERMSRNEVLCPPELLDGYQVELRAAGGKVIATAVRAKRFVDSTGKELAEDRSLWLTLTPRPLCYELSPVAPAELDKLLGEVVK